MINKYYTGREYSKPLTIEETVELLRAEEVVEANLIQAYQLFRDRHQS